MWNAHLYKRVGNKTTVEPFVADTSHKWTPCLGLSPNIYYVTINNLLQVDADIKT